jgi:hypothetical protein
MLPELRHQINRAAERYAQMVKIGDEQTEGYAVEGAA